MIALLAAQSASAQVSFTYFPSIGPDATYNGPTPYSPSLNGYNSNAVNAIAGYNLYGNSTVTNPAGTAYSSFTGGAPASGMISTAPNPGAGYLGVNSWMGTVSNMGPYGGEFGNNLFFGAKIVASPGTTFALSDLSFTATGNIAGTVNYSTDNYSDSIVGVVNAGLNNIFGDADDVLTPYGTPGTTQVIGLYIAGPGLAFAGDGSDPLIPTPITNQASMDAALAAINGAQVSGQYSLAQTSTSGGLPVNGPTATLDVVPEPTSMAVMAVGVVGLFGYAWRRRREVPAVSC